MIGEAYLRPVIATYITRYPQMKLDICFSDGPQNIVEDGFDLALRVDGILPASVIARRLAGIAQVVVAAPDYLARHGRPVRPQDLTPHMTLAPTSTGGTLSFGSDDEKIDVALERYLLLDSRFACQLALDGLGIAALPRDLVKDHLAEGRLETLLPAYRLPERHLHVIYPSRRHLPTKVRAFIDLLVETTKPATGGAPPLDDVGDDADHRADHAQAAEQARTAFDRAADRIERPEHAAGDREAALGPGGRVGRVNMAQAADDADHAADGRTGSAEHIERGA
jgi:hypothetical protein